MEKVEENKSSNKRTNILGVSLWRILAYFIIYSVLGYILETVFALVVYKVIESRQSFLYGPFCSIYGVGAVIMIVCLRYFCKGDNHLLFIGGFAVGSVTEYIISFLGEMLLKVKWWDYSNNFLNINGRICLMYSFFWGLIGVYLMRVINPRVDKFIDDIKSKIKLNYIKVIVVTVVILLFINCIVSAMAIYYYFIRVITLKDLEVAKKEPVTELYKKIYNDKEKSDFIYKHWGNEKMIKTYPNLRITLKDGKLIHIKDLYPEIRPYYWKYETK